HQFNFTDEEIEAIIAFLEWTSQINTNNWPPTIQG
ncbi:MAG: cytochrome c, partial [Magnetococcales bacterium]|nr:cytochrome c [Magnetococcales bacterium]